MAVRSTLLALPSLALLSGSLAGPVAISRSPSAEKKVIIQMFEWTWDSIASECTDFIGPAGYGYVQVSPPAEHVTGDAWWTDYQPVSYKLTSKRGDRDQLQSMINTCHTAGVNVIVDAVLNHMAGTDSGDGTAGSTFTHYDYPDIYQTQDFHHCTLSDSGDIEDYSNQEEVQTCELSNLADLATETDYVRGILADYLKDLISMGVDGFRLDAAKHMNTDDIASILEQAGGSPYITQETIYDGSEPVTPDMYTPNGDIQEFRYTSELMNAFTNGDISGLNGFEDKGFVSGSSANVFVANHDTERGATSLNPNSANNAYTLATVFKLAHPYGTPTILSGFEFDNKDDGSPNGGAGTCDGSGGSGGWLCQHRWTAISGMVAFRNTVGDAELSNWDSPSSSQISFSRGDAGFVAVNNGDSDWESTFTVSLADGDYCDVVGGSVSDGSCSGTKLSVSGGSVTATVPSRGAVAIHTGATL